MLLRLYNEDTPLVDNSKDRSRITASSVGTLVAGDQGRESTMDQATMAKEEKEEKEEETPSAPAACIVAVHKKLEGEEAGGNVTDVF